MCVTWLKGMEKAECVSGVWEAIDQNYCPTGPLGILTRAVENSSQVIVNGRDDRMSLGRTRALDVRCGMALEEVTEMWVRIPETKIKEKTLQVDDGKTTATHKKSDPEVTHTPKKGHSYIDLVNWSDNGIAECCSIE